MEMNMPFPLPPACFKNDTAYDRFEELHPVLQKIASEMRSWCLRLDVPFLITETKTTLEEDKALSRVSSTHREGRAFDMSCKGWDGVKITEFISTFGEWFRNEAAISKSGMPTLVVHHNSGHGTHFHVQVRKGLPLV
jgi:hypothetical protein